LVDVVQEARKLEEERNTALFEVSELQKMLDSLQAELESAKKRDAEISKALQRQEDVTRHLFQRVKQQSNELHDLQHVKKGILTDKPQLLQKNQELEKANAENKQHFQDWRAPSAAILRKINELFSDASDKLDKVNDQRGNVE
jgi:chromosome segregation ATPase